ncbi:hypothetical protein ACTXT7_014519 [Hymenolepis weldensis]
MSEFFEPPLIFLVAIYADVKVFHCGQDDGSTLRLHIGEYYDSRTLENKTCNSAKASLPFLPKWQNELYAALHTKPKKSKIIEPKLFSTSSQYHVPKDNDDVSQDECWKTFLLITLDLL